MELIEMVLRLNGLVAPVGDSSVDGTRLANLESLCELTGQLLDGIEAVAEATDDHLASVKSAKDVALAFLRARGVTGKENGNG